MVKKQPDQHEPTSAPQVDINLDKVRQIKMKEWRRLSTMDPDDGDSIDWLVEHADANEEQLEELTMAEFQEVIELIKNEINPPKPKRRRS